MDHFHSDSDLTRREYDLTYAEEESEKTLTLEVMDDTIAENEEIFILYVNVTESSAERCAVAVHLTDNDGICCMRSI